MLSMGTHFSDLRLDNRSRPRSVELLDDRPGGKSYSFERTAGS